MPLVGNKHFAYTPEGMKKAVAHAEKTGQKVKIDKKGIGGMVKKYSQGGMLKGPSHKKGGIPAVVKGSGQPIEMEGGEYVIKKSSADKLGPDILNYINKTGSVPKKMSIGGTVAREQEKRVKDFLRQDKVKQTLMPEEKIRTIEETKAMQAEARKNPYLKDWFDSSEKTYAALEANKVSPEELEELRKNRHSTQGTGFGGFGRSGKSKYMSYSLGQMAARNFQKNAAKRAREKAKARTAASEFAGSSGLASRGAMRARGDQKAAARYIKDQSFDVDTGMGTSATGYKKQYNQGGQINNIFSLLKKIGK